MIIYSLRNTQSTDMRDYEEFFEKYLDYKFSDFIGDKYDSIPMSMLINYNEHQHEGGVCFQYYQCAKTIGNSSKAINMCFMRSIWRGVTV